MPGQLTSARLRLRLELRLAASLRPGDLHIRSPRLRPQLARGLATFMVLRDRRLGKARRP